MLVATSVMALIDRIFVIGSCLAVAHRKCGREAEGGLKRAGWMAPILNMNRYRLPHAFRRFNPYLASCWLA